MELFYLQEVSEPSTRVERDTGLEQDMWNNWVFQYLLLSFSSTILSLLYFNRCEEQLHFLAGGVGQNGLALLWLFSPSLWSVLIAPLLLPTTKLLSSQIISGHYFSNILLNTQESYYTHIHTHVAILLKDIASLSYTENCFSYFSFLFIKQVTRWKYRKITYLVTKQCRNKKINQQILLWNITVW